MEVVVGVLLVVVLSWALYQKNFGFWKQNRTSPASK